MKVWAKILSDKAAKMVNRFAGTAVTLAKRAGVWPRAKVHSSIRTLPISSFRQIIKTGHLSPLTMQGTPTDAELGRAWLDLYDEYLAEFGLPEQYQAYLEEMAKAVKYYAESLKPGQRHLKTLARVHEGRAKSLEVAEEGNEDFAKTVGGVSKFMGFRVDPEKVSVYEFLGYVEQMRNQARNG